MVLDRLHGIVEFLSHILDHTQLFASLIARTAKDIEVLVDSLPNEESTAELQSASLSQLEKEGEEAGHKLQEEVEKGEGLLATLQVHFLVSHSPRQSWALSVFFNFLNNKK